jgi:cytosine/adenosine deaminase-related metal-dependent hydrolase
MKTRTILVRNATLVATMDDGGREIADGAVFIRGNVIEAVGPTAALPATADEVIDVHGQVVLPGLANTHHHLFQTLTRAGLPRRTPSCSHGSRRSIRCGRG